MEHTVTKKIDTKAPTPAKDGDKERLVSGLTSFQNIGNTCFMNSALQVLLSIPELSHYFLEQKFIDGLKRNSIEYIIKKKKSHFKLKDSEVKVTNSEVKMVCENSITHQMYLIFKYAYLKKATIRPTTFKRILGQYNKEFIG